MEIHWFRGEQQAARKLVEEEYVLRAERNFFQVVTPEGLSFWSRAEQEQRTEDIAQIHRRLAPDHFKGTELERLRSLMVLAETYGKVGQVENGLNVLSEVLASEPRLNDAEIYRCKGELLLQQIGMRNVESNGKEPKGNMHKKVSVTGPQLSAPRSQAEVEEAETCFLKALDIAIKQRAKSLELLASTSLARLWQRQGKQKEAHKLLSNIYNWFTEGFDTKDLKEAKALIEELSH